MADEKDGLTVTERVIDTGREVVALAHVTSAGYDTRHPLRPAGLGLIVAAIALCAVEIVQNGTANFAIKASGSPVLWGAFALAGIGIFMAVYARRQLVVRTVDGTRTVLQATSEQAAAAIVARIREGIEGLAYPAHAADTRLAHQPPRETPAIAAPPAESADHTGGAIHHPGGLTPFTPPQHSAPNKDLRPATQRSIEEAAANYRPEGYVNGHGGGHSHDDHAPEIGTPITRRPFGDYVPPRSQGIRGLSGQPGVPPFTASRAAQQEAREARPDTGREPLAIPQTAPRQLPQFDEAPIADDPAADLHALIEHVRRADVQHKEALLDLLRVVDEHYRGRASREDAIAHWRSFSDYVAQYLGGIDGLVPLADQFARHMQPR